MPEPICQTICMELMALSDGQPPSMSPAILEAHLASCAGCREELAEMERLNGLLNSQRRNTRSDDLWPLIEPRLKPERSRAGERTVLYSFLLLGASLALYKLFELVPDRRMDLVFKLVPVVIAISLFAYLKENPFKVNAQLGTDLE